MHWHDRPIWSQFKCVSISEAAEGAMYDIQGIVKVQHSHVRNNEQTMKEMTRHPELLNKYAEKALKQILKYQKMCIET